MLTLGNTNYNGDALTTLYSVLGVGNEVVQKGAAKLYPGISLKRALPNLNQTENPIGDYQANVPSGQTATTTYSERELLPLPWTVYEEFVPKTFEAIWDSWQSAGDFTNLELNLQLLNDILGLYSNGIGTQMAKLFWQGNTTLGVGNPMNKFNGIVTRAIADGNVIKPTPIGNITDTSFVDILASVWSAIPDKFLDDPNFVLHINTTDWKTIQTGNTKLHEQFTGVLGMDLQSMYNTNKIKHFQGMPRHHIIGARVTDGEDSNLNIGVWVEPDNEEPIVAKVANNGRNWFIRIDAKADANYRVPSELVLYEPS